MHDQEKQNLIEPVKIYFILGSNMDLHRSMECLINQLTTRGWHVDPYDYPNQSKTIEENYNCFQLILFTNKMNWRSF
jgi:hypothetical protein